MQLYDRTCETLSPHIDKCISETITPAWMISIDINMAGERFTLCKVHSTNATQVLKFDFLFRSHACWNLQATTRIARVAVLKSGREDGESKYLSSMNHSQRCPLMCLFYTRGRHPRSGLITAHCALDLAFLVPQGLLPFVLLFSPRNSASLAPKQWTK